MAAKRVLITGRVQGVGFRAACARAARQLGVAGEVRNLDDGRVEVVVTGPSPAVDQLVAWCRRGPRGARVERVAVTDWSDPVDVGSGFRVGR